MKVVDLINKLNDIGYDENTELTFSFVDRKTGDWHVVSFDNISYGEEINGTIIFPRVLKDDKNSFIPVNESPKSIICEVILDE